MIKNRSFFKIVALLVIISFSFVQPAWARGRRGGNSGGDLAIAAIGGAAIAAGPVLGAYIAGGEVGNAAYQASLASSTSSLAVGNIASAGLTAGGVDPHTTRLISAGAGGFAGGISSVNSINDGLTQQGLASLTSSQASGKIWGSVANSMVSSEVGYQLSQSDMPLSGAVGSLAGSFAGGFVEGAIGGVNAPSYESYVKSGDFTHGPVSKQWYNENIANQPISSSKFECGLIKGWQNVDGDVMGNALPRLAAYGASEGVSSALSSMASERSASRAYIGYTSNLAASVTQDVAHGTFTNRPHLFSEDRYKRGTWQGDLYQKDSGGWVKDRNIRTADNDKIYPLKSNTVTVLKPLDFTDINSWLDQPFTSYQTKDFSIDVYQENRKAKGYQFFEVGEGRMAEYAPYTGDVRPYAGVQSYIPQTIQPIQLEIPQLPNINGVNR